MRMVEIVFEVIWKLAMKMGVVVLDRCGCRNLFFSLRTSVDVVETVILKLVGVLERKTHVEFAQLCPLLKFCHYY